MRRVGTRTKLAVFATAAVALTSGILFPNLASAGTNGQQIKLCGDDVGGTASISGNNQNGVPTTLSDLPFNPIGCSTVANYWWVGEVTINFTTDAVPGKTKSRTGSVSCEIPKENDSPPATIADALWDEVVPGGAGSIVKCHIS